MWQWLKKIVNAEENTDHIKSFDEEVGGVDEYRKAGQQSIPTDKIVGSVGRAHELDSDFRYRRRGETARHHRLDVAIETGAPMEPIKVVKVKRERAKTEYYVVDGHHRVAQAKKHHFDEINADVTEVILHESEDDATS